MVMRGALAFAPYFERHLGLSNGAITVSRPATYAVHRDSQRAPAEVSHYLSTVHAMIRSASEANRGAYFGHDFSEPLRVWSDASARTDSHPGIPAAAFDTPEIAVDPVALADLVKSASGPSRGSRSVWSTKYCRSATMRV